MNKLLTGLLGCGALALTVAIWLQQTTLAELRDEVAGLRAEYARSQAAGRATPAPAAAKGQVPVATAEQSERGADEGLRAELAKLREELRGLKANTQEMVQFARVATAAANAKNMDTSGVPLNITPVGSLKNAGRANPAQAVESILWAATGGEVDVLAEGLLIEPKAKQKAADWFAALPEASRAQYGSPERVLALMIAKDAAALSGMQVLAQQEIRPDLTAVRVRMQADGKTKDETLAFARVNDGWRMVLPQDFLEKQIKALGGGR